MSLQKIRIVFKYFVLSNLNVVVATIVCFIAFYKLPNNQPFLDYASVAQLGLTCWAIYVLDRLRDNITSSEIVTERHKFHFEYQFILQILLVASLIVSVVITFFQPAILNIYGAVLVVVVGIYVYFISPRFPFSKEIFMPVIYCSAVVGVPFLMNSSISLSSWILAFMFFGVIVQNAFSFSYFEYSDDNNSTNICKKIGLNNTRRVINYIASINVFIVIFFFANQLYFANLLSFIIVGISFLTSLIVANHEKFKNNYRWMIDGLLFLPLIVF